ncbi:MAG: hypothetical protein ACR2QO_22800 [Acidimicrobiales bacterium]
MASALTTSFYAAPQMPSDARRLFEAACASVGLHEEPTLPLRAGRGYGSSLLLAREWDMAELEERLVGAIEASYEPTWDHARGEFTWGLGLDEEHPRGQFNAFLAAAEAGGTGRWAGLSAAPLESCPQVVGVDFPTVAMSRAQWVKGALHLQISVLEEQPRKTTTFRIVGAEPRLWEVTGIDGAAVDFTAQAVVVRIPQVNGELTFTPGSY